VPFGDSDGLRIYYDDRGAGELAFVCLAGLWLTHRMFAPLADLLAEDHRVIGITGEDTVARTHPTTTSVFRRWSTT
jgi:hypothetical protein